MPYFLRFAINNPPLLLFRHLDIEHRAEIPEYFFDFWELQYKNAGIADWMSFPSLNFLGSPRPYEGREETIPLRLLFARYSAGLLLRVLICLCLKEIPPLLF